MNLFQQLSLGESKKHFSHYVVDCFTVQNSYVNIQLHNLVEYLSAMETAQTIENAYRIW